ncbi:hypothetical protein [Ramlibacter alkalitolerans]|uniref:DnaA N-terminal domain-containing protein n=1 Tax=Ramlibacter alkalitolerans TaxID=2039631 RepID=A0ABS1JQJ3_9BURK|nr:hypothetical protein [Ramlibacter alkalitolerans]MBL0426549.1 hypothetical protein [Ramlibacter alkalitolerans]
MNRLQAELQRLYPAPAEGAVRALVLELAGAAAWEQLARVWHGVQVDLQLPAPGIAVSGSGYQLWFSVAQPVPVQHALAFLETLRRRYLADVPHDRLRTSPAAAAAPEITGMPPAEQGEDRWSAFVAPDLAALFVDEPWLDLPPGSDAQAELLSRLQCMSLADLERALAEPAAAAATAAAAQAQDPRGFLLAVMNDRAIELPLRIEAAKALLPYFEGQRAPAR